MALIIYKYLLYIFVRNARGHISASVNFHLNVFFVIIIIIVYEHNTSGACFSGNIIIVDERATRTDALLCMAVREVGGRSGVGKSDGRKR